MESARTILKTLKNLNQYLANFHSSQRPTYFELLVAKALSRTMHLPFYTTNNDDSSISHRVIWLGSSNPISRALGGGPDAISYCCNFNLVIEATANTGVRQWAREFASSIRHFDDFCSQTGSEHSNVYVLMICPKLHRDTYRSIKSNPREECKLVPIEIDIFSKILETSILAFTIRHLEIRKLLHQINDCIKSTSSMDEFRKSMEENMSSWQTEVLKLEKSSFVGVKSYEAMRKIGRTYIGASEIVRRLQKHPVVNHYFKLMGDRIGNKIIRDSLIQESLASILSRTLADDEELFEPVPQIDFRGRCQRFIDAVVSIK